MATYVYTCENHKNERLEVQHGMGENPEIPCPECERPMHRVPQAFRFYFDPVGILLDHMDDKYRDWRKRKEAQKHA